MAHAVFNLRSTLFQEVDFGFYLEIYLPIQGTKKSRFMDKEVHEISGSLLRHRARFPSPSGASHVLPYPKIYTPALALVHYFPTLTNILYDKLTIPVIGPPTSS